MGSSSCPRAKAASRRTDGSGSDRSPVRVDPASGSWTEARAKAARARTAGSSDRRSAVRPSPSRATCRSTTSWRAGFARRPSAGRVGGAGTSPTGSFGTGTGPQVERRGRARRARVVRNQCGSCAWESQVGGSGAFGASVWPAKPRVPRAIPIRIRSPRGGSGAGVLRQWPGEPRR